VNTDTRVVAYTYEADVRCVDCAFKRFGDALETEDPWGDSYPVDREGNRPWPVFSWEIAELATSCAEYGDCRNPDCEGDCRFPIPCGTCGDIIWEE
jgi:hypothetical protein